MIPKIVVVFAISKSADTTHIGEGYDFGMEKIFKRLSKFPPL
jgi:hypothetical protein